MRIALIIERMDPSRGGRETSTAQIAAELARRGHAVTVLCQSSRAEIENVSLRVISTRGLSRAARLRSFVHETQHALADGAFDVSHAMLPVPGVTVYQLRGGTRPGVLEARRRMTRGLGSAVAQLGFALNEHRRLLATLERQVVTGQTLLLPNSEMIAREIEHYYGRTEGVIVVPNGVSVPDVSQQQREQWRQGGRGQIGVKDDETVFLTVAKNFRLKGVDWAIRAFGSAFGEGGGNRLVCIGQADAPRFKRVAETSGVSDRVVFLPATPEIFPWYSAADVCVLLSWHDAASRVVLEATRWALPSITTTYNGAAEALAEGAGIVVERPDSLEAAAEAMRTLADPDQRRPRIRACAVAAEALSLERHVDGLLRAYKTVE
ncbi:MAG: glycosyltransferase family 4 protein [Phycisphaerae bacterium]|nr:glycosyltransferase family 4 protein [Phycisphaerae bacterium]